MSISQLFKQNSYDLCCRELICDTCVVQHVDIHDKLNLKNDNVDLLTCRDSSNNLALAVDSTTLRTYIAGLDVQEIDTSKIDLGGVNAIDKLVIKDNLNFESLSVNTINNKVIVGNILATDKIESNNVIYTLPIADGSANQILSTNGSGILDWKSDSITTQAGSLITTTTSVDIGSSQAPILGQILTATSGTAATWQTPGGGGLADNTLNVSTKTAVQVVSAVNTVNAATSDYGTPNTIIKRDGSEGFSSGTIIPSQIGNFSIGLQTDKWSGIYSSNIEDDDLLNKVTLRNAHVTGTLQGNCSTSNLSTNTSNVGNKTAAAVETSVDLTQAATNISTSNTLVKRNNNSDIDARLVSANNIQSSTGILEGGIISINADPTKFDISAGYGIISNISAQPNPIIPTYITWPAIIGVSVANLTSIISYVSINNIGNVIQSITRPTNNSTRDNIFLGVLVHVNHTILDNVNNEQIPLSYPLNQLYDIATVLGDLNISGNLVTSGVADYTIQKSVGEIFQFGSNYINNVKNPHRLSMAAISDPAMFQYRLSDGTNHTLLTNTLVDPLKYESAPGVLSNVGGGKWTSQRFYLFSSNVIKCMFDQAFYDSEEAALAAVFSVPFTVESSMKDNGIFISYLTVKKEATDLSDPGKAVFSGVNKFGSSGSATSNVITNLQLSYENSVANPEIITTPTGGAFSIRQGTGFDSDLQFSVQAGSGVNTLEIFGDGTIQNISGIFGTISDIRLKENILDCKPYLDRINKLKVRTYNFKDSSLKNVGFIAQELEKIFPKLVNTKSGISHNINDMKSIKSSILIPILVKAIQELSAKIDILESRPITNSSSIDPNTTNMLNMLAGKISILEMKIATK